jgi:hypothetical protein
MPSPWPAFEADDATRAVWLDILRRWHASACHDARLFPWRPDLREVVTRLERVLAAYQA